MPDTVEPTAPVAAEGGETHPEATQPPVSRDALVASWLKQTESTEKEPPEAAPVEEPLPAPAEVGTVLSQPPVEPADAPDEPVPEAPVAPEHVKLVARIRELKEKRRELKHELGSKDAEVQALRTEMAKLEGEVERLKPQPPSADPFVSVTDQEALAQGVKEAEEVASRVQETLDRFDGESEAADVGRQLEEQGVKPPSEGWTSKTVRTTLVNIRRNAERAVRSGRERSQYLVTEQQALETVARVVPELATDDGLATEMQDILRARPFLKLMPDWPVAAAAAVLGLREMKRKATPAPAPKTVPAVVPVEQPAAPVRVPKVPGAPKAATPPPQDDTEALRQRATRRGAAEEDRVALIRAMLAKT